MAQQILSQGTVLGERFEIVALAGEGDLGKVYKARDVAVDKSVALRVIPTTLLSDEAEIDKLRLRAREASTLIHRNVRVTFGMGSQDGMGIYLATEWIEGQNLRALLAKRMEAGKRFSFKGAYNIMGHVCNALNYAHKKTYHGSLSPRSIMVNNAGRVKVSDWDLSVIRTGLSEYAGRKKVESTFWSPEVLKKSGPVDFRADIYSLGALFYELITGVSPQRPLKAPSYLGFAKEVDAVVARCMADEPMKRYPDAITVKEAVAELVEKCKADDTETNTDDNLGIDVEVDFDVLGVPEPEPAIKQQNSAFSSDKSASNLRSHKESMLDAPGLPPPTDKRDRAPSGASSPMEGRASTIDMGELLGGLNRSESARWMVQKDKFDHGPFTDRELVQMILRGEVLGKHQLLDMDEGVRKKVKAWGHFNGHLERYRIKKKKEDEKAAMERTDKAETRGNAFKIILALSILGVIGLGVGGYFLSRELRKEKVYTPDEMIAALDSGEIKLRTGGNLINKKRRRGRGRRRGGGGGGGGSGGGGGQFVDGMSYDEAMNMAMNIGSLGNNSGQVQLTPKSITRIMDKNVRRFLPCMAGQSVKKVQMDIVIAGDGRVMGISVKQGDSRLQKCVASRVRGIKFPTSQAPRTAASWYFELY